MRWGDGVWKGFEGRGRRSRRRVRASPPSSHMQYTDTRLASEDARRTTHNASGSLLLEHDAQEEPGRSDAGNRAYTQDARRVACNLRVVNGKSSLAGDGANRPSNQGC